MDNKYELILTILNRGFSDLVMDSARASGATGGTIITARGAGAKEAERLFGITISQEKEIILILTAKEKRNAIMTAICRSAGLNTQGKGITFSLPVDEVFGVSLGISHLSASAENKEEEKETNDQPAEVASEETPEASEEKKENPADDGTNE